MENTRQDLEPKTAINEAIPKRSDLFTIDNYYSISQYNESLNALENNGVEYTEYINVLSPYNFFLLLDGGQKPIMMNYDTINGNEWRWCVQKVKPVKQNDEVKLYRITNKQSNIRDYINNDVFDYALSQDYVIIFNYINKEQLFSLSKPYGLIFPLGKYINGSIRLAMAFDRNIKNGIPVGDVLLEKQGKQKLGHLEAEINYKILRNQEKIMKWSMTPRFKDGKFIPTNPKTPLKI